MNSRVGFLKGLKKWEIFSYLTKKKWERNQINKVRYKSGGVTNITKIQKIMRTYTNKLDNIEGMNRERQTLTKNFQRQTLTKNETRRNRQFAQTNYQQWN